LAAAKQIALAKTVEQQHRQIQTFQGDHKPMATDILMPKMGESVQEGTILRWTKQVGDTIERDEVIAEISTDKVDTEIPSPAAGVLLEIVAQEGETVGVGNIIARIGAEGEASASGPAPAPAPPAEAPVAAPPPEPVAQPVMPTAAAAQQAAPAAGGAREAILMPKMGESVQEGTILRWTKAVGDVIERDEVIAEISTDKVDTEIPSPVAGTLVEIAAQEGETVGVGNVIAYIGTGAAIAASPTPVAAAPVAAAPAATPASAAPVAVASTNGTTASAPMAAAVAVADAVPAGPIPRSVGGRFYSPLVRTIAETEGVTVNELNAMNGSGVGGRVTKNDLMGYLQHRTAAPAVAPAAAPIAAPVAAPVTAPVAPAAAPKPTAPAIISSTGTKDYGPDTEVVPMDRMRQLIAEHMVRSKHTSPHVTEVGEADVTGLARLREGQKDTFKKQEGVGLTYTPFFIAAVARALRENPWVNSSVDGTNIIVKKRVNVGMATALPDGNLIVPVIKDADRLNITGLAHAVNDLALRARSKQLAPDDIASGTFTLTNYGVFGLLHGAPIISQPQVAILGTGAIQKRPVVRQIEGQDLIVIRSMVYLSLSHDHRVIDGLLGGKFLADVIRHLESFNESTAL